MSRPPRPGFACAVAGFLALTVVGAGSSGAAGLPAPKFASTVDIGLVSGVVVVTPRHGRSFRLGPTDRSVPVGSRIDTRHGEVDLRTAFAPDHPGKGVQDGQFAGGQFAILQRAAQQGLGVLDLVRPANAGALCRTRAARASRRVVALLRAKVHGSFRTRGRYSAATVRGTAWDTIERCDGTLTQVHRGVVSVLDLVRHKTIALRAGQSYLAKP